MNPRIGVTAYKATLMLSGKINEVNVAPVGKFHLAENLPDDGEGVYTWPPAGN